LGSAASFTGFARVYPRTVATSGLPFLFLDTQVGTLGTPADPSPLPAAEDVVISSITCLINSLIFCFVHIKVDSWFLLSIHMTTIKP